MPCLTSPNYAVSELTFTPLANPAAFRFRSTAVSTFDPRVAAEVAQIWQSSAAPEMTDDVVLRVVEQAGIFELSPIPYRYIFAQRLRPGLFETPTKSLAVSGVTWCENRLVMGRRAEWVSQDPNCLELVPSGSVEAEGGDLFRQLDREVTEELGIDPTAITAHRLLGTVDDRTNHVLDAVIEIRLICGFDEVRQAHARLDRPEYSELLALTLGELRDLIDRDSDEISAVSRTIFAHAIQEA